VIHISTTAVDYQARSDADVLADIHDRVFAVLAQREP
jgi:hypothetical protein